MSQLSQQMVLRDREMVPRALVVAMFILMAATIAIVAFARLTDRPLVGAVKDIPVVAETQLTLIGTREGNVTVLNAAGDQVAHSAEEKQGFIGVIWRVIERKRMLAGHAGSTAPIRLVRNEKGHVIVNDPLTDWSVPLVGYGPDNVAAFARLID